MVSARHVLNHIGRGFLDLGSCTRLQMTTAGGWCYALYEDGMVAIDQWPSDCCVVSRCAVRRSSCLRGEGRGGGAHVRT